MSQQQGMNREQTQATPQQQEEQQQCWYANPCASTIPMYSGSNNNNNSSGSLLSIRLMSHPLHANQTAPPPEESDRLLQHPAVTSSGDDVFGSQSADLSEMPLTKRLGVPRLLPMEFVTNNKNRVTNFVVSILVAIFFNFIFGGIAVALSIKAHNLLTQKRGENYQRRAAIYGNLAFAFNALGILSTMLLFMYLCSHPTVAHVAKFIKSLNIGDVDDQPMGNAVRSSFDLYSKSH